MTKFVPEWVRTSDPVIRSPARYRWTTTPAFLSVAVACGVRLSCSVFTVYSVLLSMSLVARALSIARRLQVYKRREHHDM